MQTDDAVQRPRRRTAGLQRVCKCPELGDGQLDLIRKRGQPVPKIGLHVGQTCFGAVKAAHRLRGGGHADLGQGGGLVPKLLDGLVVRALQRVPLLLDHVLQIEHPRGGAIGGVYVRRAPLGEPLLELAEHLRVAIAGDGRPIDHLRVLFGELVQPVFDRLKAFLPLVPQMKRQAQSVDLRLQLRQTSLEVGDVL